MEIIAEIGQNHNGEFELAKELICAAKENGADAVKFQVYDAGKLFPKEGNPWFEYNCKTQLSHDNVCALSEECQKQDIEFMASVFDTERVAWLEQINVQRYKIASRSIYDHDLVESILKTTKPVLISLGMWKKKQLPVLKSTQTIQFLHCVSKYPADLTDMHLSQVDFKHIAGLSDHTIGITAAIVAFSRGAKIIEKHFTLDKSMYGPDHQCSMTPQELEQLSLFRSEIAQCL